MSSKRLLALTKRVAPWGCMALAGLYFQSQMVGLRQQLDAVQKQLSMAGSSPVLQIDASSSSSSTATSTAATPSTTPLSYSNVVARVSPAIVTVEIIQKVESMDGIGFGGFFLRRPAFEIVASFGSGVLVRGDGLVMTNFHVINHPNERISVVLSDGRRYDAVPVVHDDRNDLAALKIINRDKASSSFPFITLADPAKCRAGDIVLAIGSQHGFHSTVTGGMISAVGRTKVGQEENKLRPLIQTDAAINSGSSGGALVDTEGRLVGINTMIYTPTGGHVGLAFAIPSNFVLPLIAACDRKDRALVRTWDGLSIQNAPPGERGVVVANMYTAGPGRKSGAQLGDRILEIDGVSLHNVESYYLASYGRPPGTVRKYRILRDGKPMELDVPIEAVPEPKPSFLISTPSPLMGAMASELSPGTNMKLGLDPTSEGIVIHSCRYGSAAHQFGLMPDDVVLEINGRAVRNQSELEAALRRHFGNASSGGVSTVKINRRGRVGVLEVYNAR